MSIMATMNTHTITAYYKEVYRDNAMPTSILVDYQLISEDEAPKT